MLRRMNKLADGELPEDVSAVSFEFYRQRYRAMTSTERVQRHRAKKRNARVATPETQKVPPNATPRVSKNATPHVTSGETPRVSASGSSSFLSFFSEQFEQAFNEKPSINYAKDRTISKRLLEQYGDEKLRGLLVDFFASDDEFIRKSGHTIGVFSSVINKLLVAKKNGHRGSFSERLWDESQREKRGET